MTTVFHARLYGRSIEIKNNLWRKKHRKIKAIFQPWELGKKYDGNFIFTFAVVKVRYGGITTAKMFKHGNYLK